MQKIEQYNLDTFEANSNNFTNTKSNIFVFNPLEGILNRNKTTEISTFHECELQSFKLYGLIRFIREIFRHLR